MTVTVMIQCEGSDYFWLVLALLTFTGATTSVFQAAVFAEASRFPPKYLQAVMSGQGIAGVAVALSSLASALASTRTSPETAAMMYFISALVITAAALVGRVVLQQQPFYRFYLGQGVKSGNNGENGHTEDDDADAGATLDTWTLIRRSRVMTCTVGYVFVVTLMLFPAITSLIKSTQSPHPPSRWLEDDMFVATHFVLFNVGDWLGRFFPLWPAFRIVRPMPLLLLSIARTVFLPLFLGCNVVVEQRQTAVWIQSDILYFAIVTLFAVSNGWIGSLAMMAAPMQPYIRHANDKANIGTLMSFALVFGLAIGGALSFWVRALV
ncbi:equilibrative nucleoside transporter [Gongronella butleri]|nr:equilibrative nucleoside transporter [Gongronella butleri]